MPRLQTNFRAYRKTNEREGNAFLKELDLTEGRATGIPTIQDELKSNGSPQATIETDDARTYFLIDIPCHREFVSERVVLNKDFIKDFIKDFTKENHLHISERQEIILEMIAGDSTLSAKRISEKISEKTDVTARTIESDIAKLKKLGILKREGGRKEGHWVIVTQSGSHNA